MFDFKRRLINVPLETLKKYCVYRNSTLLDEYHENIRKNNIDEAEEIHKYAFFYRKFPDHKFQYTKIY